MKIPIPGSRVVTVERSGAMVALDVGGSSPWIDLPPSEARQIANALLEAADECEGVRP